MRVTKLSKLFPACKFDCLDLLGKMIVFNPAKRITVKEALYHKYFEEVRDKSCETVHEGKIEMEFDNIKDLGFKKLRILLIQEISNYK